jgi:hypothetical protein
VDPAAGYQIRGKLLGPKGSYLKHIQETTGTRVQLSGFGSGNMTPEGREADHPLSLSLNAPSAEQLEVARVLAEDLIRAVKEDWYRRNPPAGAPPAAGTLPPPMPAMPPPPSGPPPPYGIVPPGYPPPPP